MAIPGRERRDSFIIQDDDRHLAPMVSDPVRHNVQFRVYIHTALDWKKSDSNDHMLGDDWQEIVGGYWHVVLAHPGSGNGDRREVLEANKCLKASHEDMKATYIATVVDAATRRDTNTPLD